MKRMKKVLFLLFCFSSYIPLPLRRLPGPAKCRSLET